MIRPPVAPTPIEVLDTEAWDAPEALNDWNRRAHTGWDGRHFSAPFDEEVEE
jgi:hypothetical protein